MSFAVQWYLEQKSLMFQFQLAFRKSICCRLLGEFCRTCLWERDSRCQLTLCISQTEWDEHTLHFRFYNSSWYFRFTLCDYWSMVTTFLNFLYFSLAIIRNFSLSLFVSSSVLWNGLSYLSVSIWRKVTTYCIAVYIVQTLLSSQFLYFWYVYNQFFARTCWTIELTWNVSNIVTGAVSC